ncbi:MAG: hypothetical protein CMJ19_24205 [Phycisphaeraceae bacterium]|nr:hypothetical protein [Phycisphaeraceae bacterium]
MKRLGRPVSRKQMLDQEYGVPDDETPEFTPEQFARAVALRDRRLNQPPKKRITINLDEDIVAFFKTAGEGYQTRINEALLRHMMRVKTGSQQHPEPRDLIYQIQHNLDELLMLTERRA